MRLVVRLVPLCFTACSWGAPPEPPTREEQIAECQRTIRAMADPEITHDQLELLQSSCSDPTRLLRSLNDMTEPLGDPDVIDP